jgi:hypothetical protein
VLFGLCWAGTWAGAQTDSTEARYRAPQLDCAEFVETAASKIHTETGGRTRDQTAGRTAVWKFRATPVIDGVSVEGWLDSLSLWRKSPDATIRPDTDGLLGGRYRGTLSATGAYTSQARPFIPDEVAEVAGMATALDDFFPPLPSHSLAPGQAWTDSAGVTLRRMADSGMTGNPLYRYRLDIHREVKSSMVANDTAPLRLAQVSREQGTYVWQPTLGLVRRDRRIVIETEVPAGRSIRQPVRSRIEQHITVLRRLNATCDR